MTAIIISSFDICVKLSMIHFSLQLGIFHFHFSNRRLKNEIRKRTFLPNKINFQNVQTLRCRKLIFPSFRLLFAVVVGNTNQIDYPLIWKRRTISDRAKIFLQSKKCSFPYRLSATWNERTSELRMFDGATRFQKKEKNIPCSFMNLRIAIAFLLFLSLAAAVRSGKRSG